MLSLHIAGTRTLIPVDFAQFPTPSIARGSQLLKENGADPLLLKNDFRFHAASRFGTSGFHRRFFRTLSGIDHPRSGFSLLHHTMLIFSRLVKNHYCSNEFRFKPHGLQLNSAACGESGTPKRTVIRFSLISFFFKSVFSTDTIKIEKQFASRYQCCIYDNTHPSIKNTGRSH